MGAALLLDLPVELRKGLGCAFVDERADLVRQLAHPIHRFLEVLQVEGHQREEGPLEIQVSCISLPERVKSVICLLTTSTRSSPPSGGPGDSASEAFDW